MSKLAKNDSLYHSKPASQTSCTDHPCSGRMNLKYLRPYPPQRPCVQFLGVRSICVGNLESARLLLLNRRQQLAHST